jgi:hypothetical protein
MNSPGAMGKELEIPYRTRRRTSTGSGNLRQYNRSYRRSGDLERRDHCCLTPPHEPDYPKWSSTIWSYKGVLVNVKTNNTQPFAMDNFL